MRIYRSNYGFTLIELMIVVAIIGILAAVAVPSYQEYTARAQISEAITITSSYKTPLAEFYESTGSYPSNLTSIGTTTSGKYVNSVTLSSSGTNVTLTATMRSTTNPGIQNSTLILTSNDGLQWDCSGGDVETRYRPGTCK